MATYQITSPDGGMYEITAPDSATQDQVLAYAQQNHQQQPPSSTLEDIKGGLASAPINMYLGIKQKFGGLSPEEQRVLNYNKEAEQKAPISSAISNIGTLAPTMLIPGLNTVAGATAIGAGSGFTQPVEGDQSLSNIATGTLKNTVLGGTAGALGQKVADVAGGFIKGLAQPAIQAVTNKASQNATRDATLANSLDAGYVVPRSLYNPSFLSNRLESLGGKAAIKQQAATTNQQVTNNLARQYLGLPEDAPLSSDVIDRLLYDKAEPYRLAAQLKEGVVGYEPTGAQTIGSNGLSQSQNVPIIKNGSSLVEELKIARDEARSAWKSFNSGSSNNATLARQQAVSADQKVSALEGQLDNLASQNGNTDLVIALRKSRVDLAKVHTIDKAMNDATGDISASNLAAQLNRNVTLTDQAKTIADFSSAFPQISQNGSRIPAPGVGKTEMLSAALLGGVGHAAAGPVGTAAALLPLASHVARPLALSKLLQKMPEYNVGVGTRLMNSMPESLSLVNRGVIPYLLSSQ